ncbi:hypothetical protein D3C85_1424350 [compost metagenome]
MAMTIAGLGISYFPRHCFQPLIDQGLLEVLDVTPALPNVYYSAMYKVERRSELTSSVIILAQACCDFTSLIQKEDAGSYPVPGVLSDAFCR